jgi:hypothetical protein
MAESSAPSVAPIPNPHRQQELYWRQLRRLKIAEAYMRLHRDRLARWVTRLDVLKAVASSGGIAGWVIWRNYAFIWAAIIAAAQLADALKDVFPFSRLHKAASEHTSILNGLFIDAQLEWENVFSGRYSDEETMKRRHKLMKLQLEAERKNFPGGLATNPALVALAEQEAKDYLSATYGVEAQP